MRAVGIILQTEIFVDLKQSLLMHDGSHEARMPRVASKEPGGSGLESAIGKAGGQFFVGRPDIGALREKEG